MANWSGCRRKYNYCITRRRRQHDKILNLLTERQREIYILHYIHGYEQVEIAEELKISKQGVNKTLQLIDKKIYKVITAEALSNLRLELELENYGY